MSTLRNAVQRRNHKERGQTAGRERFGLLEKKKDYLLRAKDYHGKQNKLKAMREKALFRNPDEFYFKMVNSQTKGGVHIQKRNEELPDEMVQLMKTQDKEYIKYQRDLSKRVCWLMFISRCSYWHIFPLEIREITSIASLYRRWKEFRWWRRWLWPGRRKTCKEEQIKSYCIRRLWKTSSQIQPC